MDATGKIIDAKLTMKGELHLTLSINEKKECMPVINELANVEKLDIKVSKHRKKRSKDANALMWACIGELSSVYGADKWDIYLMMLKRYGKFTYICVKPSVVNAVKLQWRECEEIGKVNINGTEAVQMLCYFGSSTYDSKEFTTLLNGIIYEMQEAGLQPPTSSEMRRSIEEWERRKNGI